MMTDWKVKVIKKKNKGSQTPGSAKGIDCKSTPMDRYFAKRNRSWKHPDYAGWCTGHSGK